MFAKLENLEHRFADVEQQLSSPDVLNDQERYRKLTKAHADLKEVIDMFRDYKELRARLAENKELLNDGDADIRSMAQEENREIEAALENRHALELIAEELRLAQDAVNEITGEFTPDDLLGVIFSRFCIGK